VGRWEKVSFRAQDKGKWTSQKYRILNCEYVKHATFREIAQIFIACFDWPSFAGRDDQNRTETKGKTKKGKAEALLNFLPTHPSATIPEMAAKLNLTENGVNYHLRKLQQANKLKRVGGRKEGHWQVLK